VERRAGTKGNAGQRSTCRTQRRAGVSQELERIRKVARERKKDRFTALFHHVSVDRLKGAFYQLKKDAAPGVDRLIWRDYEADLPRDNQGETAASIRMRMRRVWTAVVRA
jgi:RNA-directed DNA polymerase